MKLREWVGGGGESNPVVNDAIRVSLHPRGCFLMRSTVLREKAQCTLLNAAFFKFVLFNLEQVY